MCECVCVRVVLCYLFMCECVRIRLSRSGGNNISNSSGDLNEAGRETTATATSNQHSTQNNAIATQLQMADNASPYRKLVGKMRALTIKAVRTTIVQ